MNNNDISKQCQCVNPNHAGGRCENTTEMHHFCGPCQSEGAIRMEANDGIDWQALRRGVAQALFDWTGVYFEIDSGTVNHCVNEIQRQFSRTQRAPEPIKVPEADAPQPIPMLLWCPECGERHIDVGEFATKPHHTHACQNCGMVWRPAIVPTVGVEFLPGYRNDKQSTATVPDQSCIHCGKPWSEVQHERYEFGASPCIERLAADARHEANTLPAAKGDANDR